MRNKIIIGIVILIVLAVIVQFLRAKSAVKEAKSKLTPGGPVMGVTLQASFFPFNGDYDLN